MNFRYPFVRVLAAFISLAGFAAIASSSHAQAALTFSGGLGGSLTMTLTNTVTYTITTAGTSGPIFDFQGVGNIEPGPPSFSSSDTITYSINGGAAIGFNYSHSGYSGKSIGSNDLYYYNSADTNTSLPIGTVITLSPGYYQTAVSVTAAAPANGTYATFITDGSSNALTPIPAPEPGTWTAMAFGGSIFVGIAFLRRRGRLSRAISD